MNVDGFTRLLEALLGFGSWGAALGCVFFVILCFKQAVLVKSPGVV